MPNDCLNCDLLTCTKLLKGEGLEGGELYILKEVTNQKKVFICQLEIPLRSCCLLINTFLEADGEMDPFLYLVIQCLYDLRTSMFLAITAHYRGAIQLIRPVIETLLVGIYFTIKIEQAQPKEIDDLSSVVLDDLSVISSSDIDFWLFSVPAPNGLPLVDFIDLSLAVNDFNNWTNDVFRISAEEYNEITGIKVIVPMRLDFRFIKSWLIKNKSIIGRDNQRLEILEGILNKYIHSYFISMDISNPKCSTCPALSRYDKDRYSEWLDMFQNLIELILRKLLNDYFCVLDKEDDSSKDVTDDIVNILSNLKELEIADKDFDIQSIISKYLRSLISKIEPDCVI